MPVEVYYYENLYVYTLRGTKFIKNGTKLQEKLGQIVYNKFRPANCSHGYEVPIWISFHIRSADKFRHDQPGTRGGSPSNVPDLDPGRVNCRARAAASRARDA